jgi:hypothetical protein
MMAVVSTSETSVNFYQTTQRSILEDSHLIIFQFENVIPKRIFVSMTEVLKWGFKMLCKEELRKLRTSPHRPLIRVVKSRMRWTGHVAYMRR